MRLVITGGAGLVGSHAAEYFAAQGHDVIVFDALLRSYLHGVSGPSVEHNWAYLQQLPRVRCIRGDVRDEAALRAAFAEPVDAVIHTAAQTGIGFSLTHPLEDFQINALGTLQVLECVRQRSPRAKVVYCSTNKVYGTNVDRVPLQELATRYVFTGGTRGIDETRSIDLTGHTPYGVSKLAGELYVQDYAQTYGLRSAVFRMSCIYGERQFGFEDQGWIAHLIIAAVLGRPIRIYGDGKQVRDILYVGDLVRAFALWLASDIPHAVYNIGGGPEQTLSLVELLDWLRTATGEPLAVSFHPWRAHDQKVYVADLTKVSRELRWTVTMGVREGLRRLMDWVTAHRELVQGSASCA